MISLNQDDIEGVFFDYYEGNLSEDDKAKLFSFLDKNPLLYQDFTLWKDAYVHVLLPVTDKLESRLVKEEKARYQTNKSLSYKTIAFFGVGFLCWLFSDTHLDNKSKESVQPIAKIEMPKKFDSPQKRSKIKVNKTIAITIEKSRADSWIHVIPTQQSSNSDTISPHSDRRERETTRIDPIAISDTVAIDKENLLNQNLIKTETTPANTLSKKGLRIINKAKEKAKIHRKEQEFLKGDKPYVVPIDPTRF